MKPSQIEVVVHPQSVIHSMVQYCDGSVKAQLGMPDMKLPIQYAFGYPERLKIVIRGWILQRYQNWILKSLTLVSLEIWLLHTLPWKRWKYALHHKCC